MNKPEHHHDEGDDFMDLLGPNVQRLRDPAPVVFGKTAIADQEFQMPENQALILSTTRPDHPKAKNQLDVQRLTANRIRMNFMVLLQNQDAHIIEALDAIRAQNPRIYIELLIDIAQFITPKLKATKIVLDDETRRNDAASMREMSLEQLDQILKEHNE